MEYFDKFIPKHYCIGLSSDSQRNAIFTKTTVSVHSTCFVGTTISVIVALKQIRTKLVLETSWDIVNVLATGAHSARACEELVAIASAASNAIRTRYGGLGAGYCR
jgi:hypothetical protein